MTRDMTLARERIFGSVRVVMPHQVVGEALGIAQGSICGLSGYVFTEDRKKGHEVS